MLDTIDPDTIPRSPRSTDVGWSRPPRHYNCRAGKLAIFVRDKFTCRYCGADLLASPAAWSQATIDHVRPKCRDGGNGDENKVASCTFCNLLKGSAPTQNFAEAAALVEGRRAEWMDYWLWAVELTHGDAEAGKRQEELLHRRHAAVDILRTLEAHAIAIERSACRALRLVRGPSRWQRLAATVRRVVGWFRRHAAAHELRDAVAGEHCAPLPR